jgi:hypothetical protein
MNPTLQQIHGMLLAQHNALAQALDGTTDPDTAKAILMEMQEILHRIDLVQNLLFTQTSKQLDATLAPITKANDDLTQAVQSINNFGAFLTSTANFLKFVDQAIDIAKMVAL